MIQLAYVAIGLLVGFKTTVMLVQSFGFTKEEIDDDNTMFMILCFYGVVVCIVAAAIWPLVLIAVFAYRFFYKMAT